MSVTYTAGTETKASENSQKPARPVLPAMARGMRLRCPACGEGKMFSGYLKTVHACENCGQELHHHRADDAPPYFTITIVGHIIITAMLAVEIAYRPAIWIHMVLWLPLTLVMSLWMLPPVKGALVGLQWALYMHGFDPDNEEDMPESDPADLIKQEERQRT